MEPETELAIAARLFTWQCRGSEPHRIVRRSDAPNAAPCSLCPTDTPFDFVGSIEMEPGEPQETAFLRALMLKKVRVQ